MSTISDDEIIRRKLLIEGESGNDDRRITLLLKNYLRWIASNDVGENGSDAFQALIGSVYQCENSMEQAALVLQMNEEQQNHYTELVKDIEKQMENAKSRIEACKEELGTARVIRKNRREYDGLARIIAEHPEKGETLAKYNRLQARLHQLQKVNEDYDRQIATRKKQFHLFLYALKSLQKTVEEDELAVSGEEQNVESYSKDKYDKMDTTQ